MNPSDKRDPNKIPWASLPWDAMEEVGKVFRYGTERHGFRNWETRDEKDADYASALLRHVVAYLQGKKTDDESTHHHLAHAVANALFLIHFDMKKGGKWLDLSETNKKLSKVAE